LAEEGVQHMCEGGTQERKSGCKLWVEVEVRRQHDLYNEGSGKAREGSY